MIKNILCADIGGTNSRFAHFELKQEELKLCTEYTCKTADIHNTSKALEAAQCCGISLSNIHMQVWGIAGIISKNGLGAKLTNIALQLDFSNFVRNKNKLVLMNDFALQAWACLAPQVHMTAVLNAPSNISSKKSILQKAKAVLGGGTGLGVAVINFNQNQQISIMPSEGGHIEMPFYGKLEQDFANFAKEYLGQERIYAEDILAARGLSLLHKFTNAEELAPRDVSSRWKNHGPNEGMDLYACFLGRFCKYWALNTLCHGGLYLSGGVLWHNSQILQNKNFAQEFYLMPKAVQEIKNIPIMHIQHEHASLWGAAHAAKFYLTLI